MWETKAISLSTIEGPLSVIAKCRGDLAVHPTVKDEGWCISHANSGLRISWRGRVFRSETDAMRIADAMLATSLDWAEAFIGPAIPAPLKNALCDIYEAEDDAVFLSYDVISAPPSACTVH